MRTIVIVAILAAGCSQPANLQPIISVGGTYGMMEHRRRPPAPPAPAGCTEGCKCGGTGREPTGDGLSDSECRCPAGCKCKAKTAITGTICTTGTCAGWPPKNIAR